MLGIEGFFPFSYEKNVSVVMVKNSTNINKTQSPLTSNILTQKNSMTYDIGIPGPGLLL
jgi:hypothetical protein